MQQFLDTDASKNTFRFNIQSFCHVGRVRQLLSSMCCASVYHNICAIDQWLLPQWHLYSPVVYYIKT